MPRIILYVYLAGVLFAACGSNNTAGDKQSSSQGDSTMAVATISITSSAFGQEEMIPRKFTCDGADVSPPLEWADVPDDTRSLVLIADDPDAPRKTWVHWVMYNIPPETRKLPEGIPPDEDLQNGPKQGISDFGKYGYGGPCPPGGTHRYFFKLYALDTILDLSGRVTKQDVLDAMEGHILAEGQLMGKYSRK